MDPKLAPELTKNRPTCASWSICLEVLLGKTNKKKMSKQEEFFRFKSLNTLQIFDFCWIGHSSEPAAEGLCHARRIMPHMVHYDQ